MPLFFQRVSLEATLSYTILALGALLLLFVVPGMPFVLLAQGKILLTALALTVALISWVVLSLLRKVARVPRDLLLLLTAALPIAYALSALVTGWSAESFVGNGTGQDTVAAAMLWYGALALSALALSFRATAPLIFMRVVFVSAGVALAWFVVKLLSAGASFFTLWGALPLASSNTVGSWHDLNIIAGIVLFAATLYLLERDSSRLLKILAASGVALGAFVLIIGRFFDVLAMVSALSFAYAAWTFFERREGVVWKTGVYAVLGVLSLMLAFGGAWVGQQLPSRLLINELEVRPSWQGTFAVGQRAFSGEGSLVFGVGPNSFVEEWGKYKPSEINSTVFWSADFTSGIGSVPTSLVTTGALGLVAWMLVAGGFLFGVFRFLRVRGVEYALRRDTLVLAVVSFYFVVFHILYVPGVALSVLTFLCMGAFIAARMHASRGEALAFRADFGSYSELLRSIALVLLACLLGVAAFATARSIVSHVFINRAATIYAETGDAAAAQASIARALAVSSQNDRAHRAAVELGIITLQNLAASGSVSDADRARLQAELANTVTHGLSAVSINETNYQNWLTLAQLYQNLAGVGVEGAYEAGKSAFERARAENPTHPLPSLRLAQLEILVGNTDSALLLLDEALSKKPDFAEAHFIRSQLKAQQRDFATAEESALLAVRFAPQDPLAWYNVGAILYAQKAYAEAIPPLEQAVLLRPEYANALFLLALSHSNQGNTEQAILLLEKVLAFNPGNQEVMNLLATLKNEGAE